MGVYIKGMEMPTTGLYIVSVDNTNGRDKTIATVERMLGNRDVRQIVGSFELVPVPPHGRLMMYDEVVKDLREVEEMLKIAQFKEATNLINQAADAIETLYAAYKESFSVIANAFRNNPKDLVLREYMMKNACCCETEEGET